MDNHAPAIAGAQIDIGYRDRDRRTALALYADIFLQAVHRDHHSTERGQVRQANPEPAPGRRDLRPCRSHRRIADQAFAARVYADNILVFGPHLHHGIKVSALQRLIESGFGILRRGECSFLHDDAC